MILELLIGSWVLNGICKNIDNCIQSYDEEQYEMQAQIDELQDELDKLKSRR